MGLLPPWTWLTSPKVTPKKASAPATPKPQLPKPLFEYLSQESLHCLHDEAEMEGGVAHGNNAQFEKWLDRQNSDPKSPHYNIKTTEFPKNRFQISHLPPELRAKANRLLPKPFNPYRPTNGFERFAIKMVFEDKNMFYPRKNRLLLAGSALGLLAIPPLDKYITTKAERSDTTFEELQHQRMLIVSSVAVGVVSTRFLLPAALHIFPIARNIKHSITSNPLRFGGRLAALGIAATTAYTYGPELLNLASGRASDFLSNTVLQAEDLEEKFKEETSEQKTSFEKRQSKWREENGDNKKSR